MKTVSKRQLLKIKLYASYLLDVRVNVWLVGGLYEKFSIRDDITFVLTHEEILMFGSVKCATMIADALNEKE